MTNPVQSNAPCSFCGITPEKSLCCGGCKKISYCSQECQKPAWKTHKHACAKLSTSKEPVTSCGLTPAHIRALQGQEIEKTNSVDRFGGTPEDLAKLVAPLPSPKDEACRVLVDGKVEIISQEAFKKISGGRIFRNYPVVLSLKDFLEVRESEASQPRPSRNGIGILHAENRSDRAMLDAFEKNPPKVNAQQNKQYGGLEIVAGQRIKKGMIVCHFGGVPAPYRGTYEDATRRHGISNPMKVTGYGALVNDGFPNVELASVYGYRGYPDLSVLVTIADVEEGDVLLASYGPRHSVLSGIYTIDDASFKRASDFCRKMPFETLQEKLSTLKGKEGDATLSQLKAIVQKSNLFLRLHLEGVLNPIDTIKFMKTPVYAAIFDEHEQPLHFDKYEFALKQIQEIHKKQKNIIPSLIQLQGSISANTYILMICYLDLKNPQLNIESYQRLGEMFDKISLYIDGTLIGTKIGKKVLDQTEKKGEDEELDPTLVQKFYQLKDRRLEALFCRHLNDHIKAAEQDRRDPKGKEKAKALSALLKTLSEKYNEPSL